MQATQDFAVDCLWCDKPTATGDPNKIYTHR